MHKKKMKPRESFPFNMWLAAEKASFSESWLSTGRDLRRREWYQCRPHLVVMRWFVCMPVASLDEVSMWVYLCENQSAGFCVFVGVRKRGGVLDYACVVSPGWGVCVSDVNSVLSARFSTLPAAVKRARPSLPPPRGLISFFILSAIQLDFLWGHRGQGPFTKRDELGECVRVCVCICVHDDTLLVHTLISQM